VVSGAPYDYILLYDVIDHYQGDLEQLLPVLKTLMSRNSRIIMRTHPWTSRHGGHQWSIKNLSHVHLFEELDLEYNVKVCRPLGFYERLISAAKLKVQSKKVWRTPVPKRVLEAEDKLTKKLGLEDVPERTSMILEVDYIDYFLEI
jgi:hypothetical protein